MWYIASMFCFVASLGSCPTAPPRTISTEMLYEGVGLCGAARVGVAKEVEQLLPLLQPQRCELPNYDGIWLQFGGIFVLGVSFRSCDRNTRLSATLD